MSVVIIERDGPIATVTLNRPEAMNALSQAMRWSLADAMLELEQDISIKVIILTGAGDRAFTAGLDLKELGDGTVSLGVASDTSMSPLKAIETCSKPVIGAINGVAITGGLELAMACDIVIASSTARFADTHARVGVVPGWGLSQKLSRLIGIYRAKELSLSGNFIDAQTAAAWGLVNRVVDPIALMSVVRMLATDIAQIGALELTWMKRLIDDGYGLPYRDAIELEHERSIAHNRGVSSEQVAERRLVMQARSRESIRPFEGIEF